MSYLEVGNKQLTEVQHALMCLQGTWQVAQRVSWKPMALC